MFYLIFFVVVTFALSEYFYHIYKESKYYKEDLVSISYVGNHSDNHSDISKNKLKTKDL